MALAHDTEVADTSPAVVVEAPRSAAIASQIGNRAMGRLLSCSHSRRASYVSSSDEPDHQIARRALADAVKVRRATIQRYGHENNCTKEDLEERIWPGDYFARQLVDRALKLLSRDPPPPYVKSLLKDFFSTDTPDLAVIKGTFERLRKQFEVNDHMYKCLHDCKATKEDKTLGRTDMGSWGSGPRGAVGLCMNSLSVQMRPVEMTGATILHEFLHRYVSGFSGDHYCDSNCGGLEPSKALKNADSYSTFALALWNKDEIETLKARRKAERAAGAP